MSRIGNYNPEYRLSMKPLNSYPKHKRKKLQYIRTKFQLSNGLRNACLHTKIPRDADSELFSDQINQLVHEIRKQTFEKYKIQLNNYTVQCHTMFGDFERGLFTLQVVAFNKK